MPGELIVPATKGIQTLWHSAGKHAPVILTVVAAGSAISSVVSAVKATPRAMVLLEQKKKQVAKEEKMQLEEVVLTPTEVIKTTWKCYMPSAAMLTISVGCMFGAAHINAQRELGWAALYSATKKASDAYEKKVIERIGEKENAEIHQEVIKQELKDHPVSRAEVVTTGAGSYLVYDTLSGRYFMSDINEIQRIANELNQAIIGGRMYVALNEFYDELNLMPIDLGHDCGWNIDNLIDPKFSTMISDDGRPCLTLQFWITPKFNYML